MMMLNSLELLLLSGIEEALPSGSSLLPPTHPSLWLLLPPALILKNQKKIPMLFYTCTSTWAYLLRLTERGARSTPLLGLLPVV